MAEEPSKINLKEIDMEELEERLGIVIREATRAKILMTIIQLKNTVESSEIQANLAKGVLDYVAAAGALAFACKEMDDGNISMLLKAAGIDIRQDMLTVVKNLHYKNYNLYLNAIYSLESLKIDPTIDMLTRVLRAIDESPDAIVAGYAIEYYKEFSAGRMHTEKPPLPNVLSMVYDKSYEVTISLYDILARFGLAEMDKILKSEKIRNYKGSDLLPYISAIGMLSFSGKEVDKGSIKRVVLAYGFEINDLILSAIGEVHVRNHEVYIIGLYFLNAANKDPTIENVIDVVRAFGVEPDISVAEYAMNFYKIKDLTEGLDK